MAVPLKIVPQGRAPNFTLAFERDGKVWAYLIPADEHKQECFDAMREIAQTWKKLVRIPKRTSSR